MGSEVLDVCVVGGGAAGLIAAIVAARDGKRVCIVEKNDALGLKLRLTGGQFANKRIGPDRYHNDGAFAWSIIQRFNPERVITFFRALGIEFSERRVNERSTLISGNPEAVTQAIEKQIADLGIDVLLSSEVTRISQPASDESHFGVHTDSQTDPLIVAKRVIYAVGGKGYPQWGADQTGLRVVRELGHAIVPQYAASTMARKEIRRPLPDEIIDWREVVVTGGGVSVGEIDAETMESKIIPGLYLAGEAIDIQGDRGGFNLQFAFASGRLAGHLL